MFAGAACGWRRLGVASRGFEYLRQRRKCNQVSCDVVIESTRQLLIENVCVLHKLPLFMNMTIRQLELQASKFVATACVARLVLP